MSGRPTARATQYDTAAPNHEPAVATSTTPQNENRPCVAQ